MAVGNILRVKVNIPPPGTNIITRPSLLEYLEEDLTANEGFSRHLTLISAPAGFGKTTLAREWVEKWKDITAWYSLDSGDNEPERFWFYLVSALQTVHDCLGKGTLEVLRAPSQASGSSSQKETLLTPLLNDLFVLEEPVLLVLDDYHQINNPDIQESMVFFIENLPPTLHLVVTTRSEPPWPLYRWRVKGNMKEIRQKNLKFSPEESSHLFNQVKGLQLSESQVNTLFNKTEGWITGLQLAAISLSTSQNKDEFIDSFAGAHRHVLHFLSEEVFTGLPKSIQDFLMQTSILNRFCAPLCNAVTGREDCSDVLMGLERDNLFVIPLDDQGIWYRYHALFADLLLHHLKNKYPDKISLLNIRAAQWFLEAGEPGEAVRHALKSESPEKTAQIIDEYLEEIMQEEGPGLVIQCLDSLPPEILKKYPYLAVQKSWFYFVYKGKDQVKKLLELAEEVEKEAGSNNQYGHKEIAGMLEVVKAYYNVYYARNSPRALENAQKALELLPSSSNYWRSKAGIISGDAWLFSGNPKDAYSFYREAFQNDQAYGNLYLILTTGFKVATSLYYLGRLQESQELIQEMIEKSNKGGLSRMYMTGLSWTLLGELLREGGSLKEAEHCMERGLFISEPSKPSLGWNYLYIISLAFSKQQYDEALATVGEIENLHQKVALPDFVLVPAAIWKARIFLELGKFAKAREALSRAGISEDKEIQGGKERGYLFLSRILLLEGKGNIDLARKFLDNVEKLAASGEYRRLIIETHLAKAFLEKREGKLEAAENHLAFALQSGKEARFFQVFVDEGRPLGSLYAKIIEGMRGRGSLTKNKELLEYIKKICNELSPEKEFTGKAGMAQKKATKTVENSYQELVEDLSAREIEVLSLLAHGLSNQEISKKLYLSVGTVKWHTSNIYGKLGVRNRAGAVAMAQKLNLLGM